MTPHSPDERARASRKERAARRRAERDARRDALKAADQRGKSFYTHAELEAAPSRRQAGRLRAVTYNIHKGIGGIDRLYRIERVIEVLARLDPDFCLLQEVDEGVPRSRRERQAEVIADALGLPYRVFGPNVRLREGHYGNAILSRFAIDHHENIDLTVPPKKRRSALHARVHVDLGEVKRRLWLLDVHLGLSGLERRAQVRHLLEWIRHHHPAEETAVVLGGDFNDVFDRLGHLLLIPAGFRTTTRTISTFPARRPLRPLDKVFLRGPIASSRLHRPQGELLRQASDHLPLVCDFEVR